MKKNLTAIADELIERLLDCGFIIQRYDAYSTNSIYLKLDYGVSNSIRISDHRGKQKLSYRYNIGSDIAKRWQDDGQYTRYYFPADQIKQLVKLIIQERNEKIQRYGTKNYFQYMERNKEAGQTLPGFWQQARLIERR